MPSQEPTHKYTGYCCAGKPGCGCCVYLSHRPDCFQPARDRLLLKKWQGERMQESELRRAGVEDIQVKGDIL